MIDRKIIREIIDYLTGRFGKNLVSVYGIGSAILNDLPHNDIDIVVILNDISPAPSYDWTTARFETVDIADEEVWLLYGKKEAYFDKTEFCRHSFANWEWSVRSMKYGSEHLYGEDFRDELPEPDYDYEDIFKRAIYHLEPISKYKRRKFVREGKNPINQEMLKLTKSIFKFGFFLVSYLRPDENIFGKRNIYHKLLELYEESIIDGRLLDFFEKAFDYRGWNINPGNGEIHQSFGENLYSGDLLDEYRVEFAEIALREAVHLTSLTVDSIRCILREGFGKPFSFVYSKLEEIGWGT